MLTPAHRRWRRDDAVVCIALHCTDCRPGTIDVLTLVAANCFDFQPITQPATTDTKPDSSNGGGDGGGNGAGGGGVDGGSVGGGVGDGGAFNFTAPITNSAGSGGGSALPHCFCTLVAAVLFALLGL